MTDCCYYEYSTSAEVVKLLCGESLYTGSFLVGYREIRQTQHSMLIHKFNKMPRTTCFDPLKGPYKKLFYKHKLHAYLTGQHLIRPDDDTLRGSKHVAGINYLTDTVISRVLCSIDLPYLIYEMMNYLSNTE